MAVALQLKETCVSPAVAVKPIGVEGSGGFVAEVKVCHQLKFTPPEFLPTDKEAPEVNRDRAAYAEAVLDLLAQLDKRFDLLEVEVPVRLGEEMPAEPEGAEAA